MEQGVVVRAGFTEEGRLVIPYEKEAEKLRVEKGNEVLKVPRQD